MKKFLLGLVAVAFLSPVFAEEKKDDHASTGTKTEATEKKSSERAEKEASAKGELSKKLDACLNERPQAK
ncbi:MAG: hypothetical protein EB078_05980 [Proteobacteria bacterium]|nr:hypothetical protein [Pseudomonadota bacterium]NDC23228.1 hypothetical protein [Pseudomonadota bacterium]NDD04433.1 hypothetical protein [Pseudomonadota bacterium]NDG27697.1 hypothetical protein [Pseudomonadota bacterium]